MKVVIRGSSAAASCCNHLLKTAGFVPVLERTSRPGVPAIMLSDSALTLMRDVFQKPGLFRTAPRINRRVVKWGPNSEPVALDHSAVVVSERELLQELQGETDEPGETAPDLTAADFTIFASRPLPPGSVEHCFGSRVASAAKIRLKDPADSATCWIESLEDGWLFLIPNSIGSGWLLSVGSSPQTVLSRSRLIAGRIASMDDPVGQFPAGPRIVSPLSGVAGAISNDNPAWAACGTAGLAFDPICGDGTAHAVREAILASAVVRGISSGGDPAKLLAHYEARLTAGFYRHLVTCLDFYRTGEAAPWWNQELDALKQGLEWCADRAKNHGQFRYQLNGYDLQATAG